MTKRIGVVAVVMLLAAAGVLIQSQGCGSDGGPRATFAGNVSDVTLASRPAPARFRFALSDWFVPRAIAQGACPAGVEDLLACAVSITQSDLFFTCTAINPGDCTFRTQVRIPGNGAGTLAFAQDENGNGQPDEGEPGAFPAPGEIPFEVCNGDVIEVTDVVLDFTTVPPGEEFSQWTAASVVKETNGCPATPTPTPSATSTSGPTATPTPTGSPAPTATPTETPAP